MSVKEFKAGRLSLLDEIGKSLAAVGAARPSRWKSPEGMWAGKVQIIKDSLDTDTSALWEVSRGRPKYGV